jgi:hypothetical protein
MRVYQAAVAGSSTSVCRVKASYKEPSQGIQRFDLRQSRYFGFARTHLQQLLTATAMHSVRVIAWSWEEP